MTLPNMGTAHHQPAGETRQRRRCHRLTPAPGGDRLHYPPFTERAHKKEQRSAPFCVPLNLGRWFIFFIERRVVFPVYPAEEERQEERSRQIDVCVVVEVIDEEFDEQRGAEPGENTACCVLRRPVQKSGKIRRFMFGDVPHACDGKDSACFVLDEADIEMIPLYEAEKEGAGYHHQP